MSTDLRQRAEGIIDRVYALLDESILQRKFDAPINQAVQTFLYPEEVPIDCQAFHRTVGQFTRHIYEQGLQTPWKVSLTGPLAAGLALLEKHYQGTYASGYAGARLDAADAEQVGIGIILHRLAEAIKGIERELYIRWVFARYLHGLGWNLRVMVAQIVLERHQAFLPPSVWQCSPAQMAEEIPTLIQISLAGESTLRQITDSS